jgi:hypothetical protein
MQSNVRDYNTVRKRDAVGQFTLSYNLIVLRIITLVGRVAKYRKIFKKNNKYCVESAHGVKTEGHIQSNVYASLRNALISTVNNLKYIRYRVAHKVAKTRKFSDIFIAGCVWITRERFFLGKICR